MNLLFRHEEVHRGHWPIHVERDRLRSRCRPRKRLALHRQAMPHDIITRLRIQSNREQRMALPSHVIAIVRDLFR